MLRIESKGLGAAVVTVALVAAASASAAMLWSSKGQTPANEVSSTGPSGQWMPLARPVQADTSGLSSSLSAKVAAKSLLGAKGNTNDYDGDGRADIHWRNLTTGQNDLWLMNGASIKSARTIYNEPNPNWYVVGSGDFNGDGRMDVLWRNTSTGQVYVQHQNAGVTLATSGFAPTVADQKWQIVAIADFNDDNRSDLYWRNDDTGRNDLWLMNGTGPALASTVYLETNTTWKIAGAGDFNGDGRADVFWRNDTTGNNYIQFMSGFSVLGGSNYVPTVSDQNWQVVAIRDFNNDGYADFYWRNFQTGRNDMWLMEGTRIKGFATVYFEQNQDWQIFNSGDYNADGFPDLLWRNSSTGDNYIMFIQGFGVLATSAMLPRVANTSWLITGLPISN
jgi:peptidyl-Asp metalloendopeptidase